jgi:MYXO-CTERM domain-containing protein
VTRSAVLLADGRAALAASLDGSANTLSLYDPATNTWRVGPSGTPFAELAVLPSGEVLLGHPSPQSGFPPLDALCNPALDVCSQVGGSAQQPQLRASTQTAAASPIGPLYVGLPTVTPLASGEVLLAGGLGMDGSSAAVDVFSDGADAAWRPTLADPGPLRAGERVTLTGTLLEGLSHQGVPSFTLRSLLTGRLAPLTASAFTASSATVQLPALFTGPYQLSVTVDGVTGGRMVSVVGNGLPIASDLSLEVPAGKPSAFTISASDPEDDALTYSVVLAPAHGTLSGTAPELTYTPEAGFSGPDRFRFQASDGTSTSNVATVTLQVSAQNQAPQAISRTLSVAADGSLAVTLSALDAEGDPLTYAVVTQPSHGTLTGDAPALTYTPAPGYLGEDAFTFQANDGTSNSAAGTISISVVQALTPEAPSAPNAVGCTASGSNGGGAPAAFLALGLLAFALRRRTA